MARVVCGIAVVAAIAGCSVFVGDDDAPATDAAVADGPTSAPDAAVDAGPDCEPSVVIRDDFSDGAIDPRWTAQETGGIVTEAGQRLEIAPADMVGGNLLATDVDLTEGEIVARATPPVDPQVATWVLVRSAGTDSDMAAIVQLGPDLVLKRVVAGVEDNPKVTYVPSSHTVWRIRIASNRIYWEAGPNAQEMSVLREETLHFSATDVDAGIRASTLAATSSVSRFDDVDIATQPATGWCVAGALRDDLDGVLAPRWELFARNQGVSVADSGQVALTPQLNVASSIAGMASDARFRLADSSIAAEVEPSAASGVQTNLELKFTDQQRLGFALIQGNLRMYDLGAFGERFGEVTYDPVAHRWWRVVDNPDGMRWEVSADGDDWTIVRTITDEPVNLTSLRVLLFAHTPAPAQVSGTSIVERVGER